MLHGPGGKISLFLEDGELAKVASGCHMALDMLCQEVHEACCHGMSAVLSPWTGCDTKRRRVVVRENKGRRHVSGEPF